MGRLYDSLLSGSSGKVGRVVVANVYGNEILRKRPRRRTSEPTPKQALVQERMTRSYDFLLPYKDFAKNYFGQRSGLKSTFNIAMANVMKAHQLDFQLMEINLIYADIEFSRGELMAALPTGLASNNPGTFSIDWVDNSGADPIRETDKLQLLFVAEDEKKPVLMENLADRVDGTLEVPVSAGLIGKTVHVWMSFRAQDLSDVANSAYAGSVLIT